MQLQSDNHLITAEYYTWKQVFNNTIDNIRYSQFYITQIELEKTCKQSIQVSKV